MPVNDAIYEQMLDEFCFDPDYSVKCIEANRHNNITATYHLLFKRAQRQDKPFTNVTHVAGSLDRRAEMAATQAAKAPEPGPYPTAADANLQAKHVTQRASHADDTSMHIST